MNVEKKSIDSGGKLVPEEKGARTKEEADELAKDCPYTCKTCGTSPYHFDVPYNACRQQVLINRAGILERLQFCPDDCLSLNITEKRQDLFEDKLKPVHTCLAFNARVLHLNAHPKLYRCNECSKIAKKIASEL